MGCCSADNSRVLIVHACTWYWILTLIYKCYSHKPVRKVGQTCDLAAVVAIFLMRILGILWAVLELVRAEAIQW